MTTIKQLIDMLNKLIDMLNKLIKEERCTLDSVICVAYEESQVLGIEVDKTLKDGTTLKDLIEIDLGE